MWERLQSWAFGARSQEVQVEKGRRDAGGIVLAHSREGGIGRNCEASANAEWSEGRQSPGPKNLNKDVQNHQSPEIERNRPYSPEASERQERHGTCADDVEVKRERVVPVEPFAVAAAATAGSMPPSPNAVHPFIGHLCRALHRCCSTDATLETCMGRC